MTAKRLHERSCACCGCTESRACVGARGPIAEDWRLARRLAGWAPPAGFDEVDADFAAAAARAA